MGCILCCWSVFYRPFTVYWFQATFHVRSINWRFMWDLEKRNSTLTHPHKLKRAQQITANCQQPKISVDIWINPTSYKSRWIFFGCWFMASLSRGHNGDKLNYHANGMMNFRESPEFDIERWAAATRNRFSVQDSGAPFFYSALSLIAITVRSVEFVIISIIMVVAVISTRYPICMLP